MSRYRAVSVLLRLMWPFLLSATVAAAAQVDAGSDASPRISYAAERLKNALQLAGIDVPVVLRRVEAPDVQALVREETLRLPAEGLKEEGFLLTYLPDRRVIVVGADDSGVLYGAIEVEERLRRDGGLPTELHFIDAPTLRLRGPCIGMQKTYILPGRKVYEYPYTPELFPFFYDKAFWRDYLDQLVELRMNTLYLWNGHPFASLVKLEDYPYALEVSEEVFARNVEMMHYITEEADKRGIWLVQMFYNILLPKPLAERHGLPTQLDHIEPVAADYTRKSIAAFVEEYPNVGLLVCLGEALQDIPQQTEWCTDVILAGVKDGMRRAGLTEEPPIVIRAHATDESVVMPAALQVYRNLYTMAKFNGESLTTWEPRGVWQERHLAMSRLGSTHVVNVHILANLEPFRYGAPRFIQRSVQASRDRLGAGGLHVYPLAYWSWPYAPDRLRRPEGAGGSKTEDAQRSTSNAERSMDAGAGVPARNDEFGETRLHQLERDWIWFEAWARYAWDPDIEPAADRAYWVRRLSDVYGSDEAAALILSAYNDSGECAPRLLRRFGITEGNRQTLSLGMTLEQLVDPEVARPYPELWKSQAPPGERLQEYVEREWRGEPHEGETPPQIIDEVLMFSRQAVEAVEVAAPLVSRNHAEFERLRNDMHCIQALSQHYAEKVRAAYWVLWHRQSGEALALDRAEAHLARSLEHFRELERLTRDTYHFANSMQTGHRRVPVRGAVEGEPAYYHWSQVLPVYEEELREFRQRLAAARARGDDGLSTADALRLQPAAFQIASGGGEAYRVAAGARVFVDQEWVLQEVRPELRGLRAVRFAHAVSREGASAPVVLQVEEPVRVLIGYVREGSAEWRRPPDLDTDSLAAERGGTEPLLRGAVTVSGLGLIDVYELRLPAGRQAVIPRGTGSFLVLGVVTDGETRP